jgi:D-alanyl-D-alanine carboxypeptidase (penicillin-binding protein 5/6)
VNRNDLVGTHNFVDGVKTGHTSHAGWILVGAAHRNGARVISVVLDEASQPARDSETLALLRYGLGRFTRVTIHSRTIKLVNVKNYDLQAPLRPGRDLTAAVLRGSPLHLRIYPPIIVRGPLPPGYSVGIVSLYSNDHPVARAPLVTAERVPGASLGRVILIKLGNGDAALACGVIGVAVLLALRISRSPMLTRGRTSR